MVDVIMTEVLTVHPEVVEVEMVVTAEEGEMVAMEADEMVVMAATETVAGEVVSVTKEDSVEVVTVKVQNPNLKPKSTFQKM